MLKYISFLFILFCISCKNNGGDHITSQDTTAIFNAVFNDKEFLKENVYFDTLYFLKNKYYNCSWPSQSNYFKLVYIDDVPKARIVNFGPNYPYDGRKRISVSKFNFKNDTLSLLMECHGNQNFLIFELIKRNNNWLVVRSLQDEGGKKPYYGFEKEQWYLDMKKKIKPVKPMFPPAEPKEK